ncbi:TPA: hypothetical protein ACGO6E_000602 [Streptococcus suis]
MNKQKNFTDTLNSLILYAKSQGVSTKDISDEWHTFGELYYHRMILTLALMRQNKDKAWKSKQHHDGTMFEDSFICGIDTPEGQYSYHYDLEHWELFNVKELDKAPEYDGHKPEDVTRLLSLEEEQVAEKLGVLLVGVPEPSSAKYYYLEYSHGNYSLFMANEKEIVVSEAMLCTKEEAKKYPQFRWVSLEGL